MASDAFIRAVIGPVGSGKSSACVVEIIRRAAQQRPHQKIRRSRWAIIRNTYGELRDTTRKTFEQWVPPGLGRWHEQSMTFTVERALADGTQMHCEVLFRALDRPEDVKKLLSLELTGAYINEAREVPKHVLDVLQSRVGRYPSMLQGGASWFGVWLDSNPWATSHWGYQLFSKDRPTGHELYEQPDGLSPQAENVENLPAGYYDRLTHGKDVEWVDEYVRARYPSSDKGSIFGDWLDKLEQRAAAGQAFEHPSDGVHVNLDLGVSDATALWFWRLNQHGVPDFIDWYEATGQGASHFFEVIDKRGWRVDKIWLPHDARARTFQTGVSTVQLFGEHFGPSKVQIGPELSLEDGIGAGRWLLEQPVRFHARCAEGLTRLRAYRYVWDEAKKVFTKKPLHDWTSHTADSFRYSACVVHATAARNRKPAPPAEAPPARALNSFNLSELFEANESTRRRERI
jgi:hypothetical protein